MQAARDRLGYSARMTEHLTDLSAAVERILQRIDGPLRVGAPLGIGKPHRLLNALYAQLKDTPSRPLAIYTALSLNPQAGCRTPGALCRTVHRAPFWRGFPSPCLCRRHAARCLAHACAGGRVLHAVRRAIAFRPGPGRLHEPQLHACRRSGGATRAQPDRAKVAREPGGTRLSLSCNNDITQDTLDAVQALGLPRPMLVAEVDPQLPWMGGAAAVDAAFFDLIIDLPGPFPQLFGLPRQAVNSVDYAIGLYASALVRDGGTLQIGIGTLADALSHALVLRHTDNATYRRVLHALDPALSSTRPCSPAAAWNRSPSACTAAAKCSTKASSNWWTAA